MKNNIDVKTAIDKVNEIEWSKQKNGKLSMRNARVFGKFYGFQNFLNDLATDDVREFKNHCRTKLSYKNGTINRKLASLSKLCTWARGVKGFQFKWGIPLIEYDKENNQRKFTVSKELEEKILSTARSTYRDDEADLWECLIHTGCRVSELLNLTWEDVQDDFIALGTSAP